MLQRISIQEYVSFPGVRWRLKDPATRLVLKITGRPKAHTFQRYRTWFDQRYARCFRLFEGEFPADWLVNPEADPLAVHLAAGITALQRLGMQPVRRAQVLEAAGDQIVLALPSFHEAVLSMAIRLAIQLLLELDALEEGAGALPQQLGQDLEEFLAQAPELSRCGANQLYVALAADQLRIPIVATVAGILQIGHGSARTFHSNSLLKTSRVSAQLASDKMASYLLLHRAGIPLPITRVANCEADLAEAAAAIGVPVVVKPLDRSLKMGVTKNVVNEADVQRAWRSARDVSKASVLVQEQIEGREFRLTAIGSDFAVARELIPAGVDGDGCLTVLELVERCNQDPRRGNHSGQLSRCIELGDEALELLREQSLSLEAVPALGQRVRLSHLPGRRFGGTVVSATHHLHPSYFDLLHRAARILQLDVVGMDLVTPDPSLPWWDAGARVLECNPRPGLYQHDLAEPALRIHHRVLRDGRAGLHSPCLVALATGAETDRCRAEIRRVLAGRLGSDRCLGELWQGLCSLGGQPLPQDPAITDQVGQALLAEPLCGAALLAWRAEELARYGRPCETLDLALLSAGAEPLVLQECLDADPEAVIWLGPDSEAGGEALARWQRRCPGRPLHRLARPEELAGVLPLLWPATEP